MNESNLAEVQGVDASRERMGSLLRFGVMMAATLVLLGGFFYFIDAPAATAAAFSHFQQKSMPLRIQSNASTVGRQGNAKAIIQLGILVLIGTPIARVMLALATFARAKDWIYVALSTLILSLLLFSLFFG